MHIQIQQQRLFILLSRDMKENAFYYFVQEIMNGTHDCPSWSRANPAVFSAKRASTLELA